MNISKAKIKQIIRDAFLEGKESTHNFDPSQMSNYVAQTMKEIEDNELVEVECKDCTGTGIDFVDRFDAKTCKKCHGNGTVHIKRSKYEKEQRNNG